MTQPFKQFGDVGVVANTRTPGNEELYISPDELRQIFDINATEAQIRFAMSLVNAHINRPSIFVEQYEERLEIPQDRNQLELSATPVVRILSAAGRYGYGRRDRRSLNQVNYDYIAATAVFGSPPRFTEIDVDQIELFPSTGEVWLPTGFFLINYTQVNIRYLAGFTKVPNRIKTAMVEILNNICQKQVSDRVSYAVGRVSRRFSSSSFITPQAEALLEPFVIRALA